MKLISLAIVLSTLLLAGCGSGGSAGGQMAADASKPVATADECQAKSTDAERSDCMYDRMIRTPVNTRPAHRSAPVIDPLLGKPVGDVDPKPAPASSSAPH